MFVPPIKPTSRDTKVDGPVTADREVTPGEVSAPTPVRSTGVGIFDASGVIARALKDVAGAFPTAPVGDSRFKIVSEKRLLAMKVLLAAVNLK